MCSDCSVGLLRKEEDEVKVDTNILGLLRKKDNAVRKDAKKSVCWDCRLSLLRNEENELKKKNLKLC